MSRHLVTLLLVAFSSTTVFAEDLATMLTYVPKEANALMAVHVKGMMASPMAAKEGWKKRITEETIIGLLPFPETAEYAVVTEQLQPGSLQGKWELVLISTTKPYSFQDIAKAEKSEIESIGSTPVCFTKRNMVILQLSPTLLGVFSPAHRQDVARWLKAHDGKALLSPALARVSDAIKDGNVISLIFDVEDTLEVNKVKQFVASQKDVIEKKLDITALSKTFSSLTSVSFNIRLDQAVQATMKAEFSQNVGTFGVVLPNLVINAMDGIGADLEEYRKGTSKVTDKAFEIQTNLTPAGLKATLAMVQPNSITPAVANKGAGNKPEDDPAKEAQRVFRKIQSIANTANDQAEKSSDIARAMVIYDNAATRLDKLPVSQTDLEIQQFSADVSKALREIATTLHSGVLEVMTLEGKIRTDVKVDYRPATAFLPNPWGFSFWNPMLAPVPQYNIQSNQADIIAAQQDAITRAVRKRNEIWRQLIDKSVALKKALSIKYGIAF